MADIETRSSGSLKWVGWFAASAITAALIFWMVRPAPSKPAIAPTEFDGYVADSSSRQLLRNASITVTLGPYSAHQVTDTFGRYSLVFPSPSPDPTMADVEIQVAGYGDYKNTVALRPGSNYAEIALSSMSLAYNPEASPRQDGVDTSTGAPQAAASQIPAAKAQITFRPLPRDFMKANTTYAGGTQKR
jgi:hypothetical protein